MWPLTSGLPIASTLRTFGTTLEDSGLGNWSIYLRALVGWSPQKTSLPTEACKCINATTVVRNSDQSHRASDLRGAVQTRNELVDPAMPLWLESCSPQDGGQADLLVRVTQVPRLLRMSGVDAHDLDTNSFALPARLQAACREESSSACDIT